MSKPNGFVRGGKGKTRGGSTGWCSQCRKMIYISRRDARYASRNRVQGKLLRDYVCPHTEGWYHIGNTQGRIKRGDYYPEGESA